MCGIVVILALDHASIDPDIVQRMNRSIFHRGPDSDGVRIIDNRVALAMRWLVSYSRNRTERTMAERLAAEILEASANRGGAVKKREDTHKMAEANKAFAHYRW